MKRRKTLAMGIASGVACAACVGLFMWHVAGQAEAARAEALARYGGEQVEVCVAARDIAVGETVDAGAIDKRLWLADLLPAEAVVSPDSVVGRTVSSSVLQGEVLSEKRFAVQEGHFSVPAGFVAVGIPARDVQAVGGAVAAGMRVDVYATGDAATSRIVSDALVLSTSTEAGGLLDGSSSWITLAIAPERVQEVVAAIQTTELYFTLPGEGVTALLDDAQGAQEDASSAEPSAESPASAAGEAPNPSDEGGAPPEVPASSAEAEGQPQAAAEAEGGEAA